MKQFELQTPISQLFNALKSQYFACELFSEQSNKSIISEKMFLERPSLEQIDETGNTGEGGQGVLPSLTLCIQIPYFLLIRVYTKSSYKCGPPQWQSCLFVV